MTTMIVGGGPTGVEMAGAVAELAQSRARPATSATSIRAARKIILIEAGPRVLAAFPVKLSDYAQGGAGAARRRPS